MVSELTLLLSGGDGLVTETHRCLLMIHPKPFSSILSHSHTRYFFAQPYPLIMAQTRTYPDSIQPEEHPARNLTLTGDAHVQRAWAHWTNLGRPKLIVAPMVDNSELPFRLLCKKYGAQAAYTPMLHSRIFSETEKYRKEEFTTCKVGSYCFHNYNCCYCYCYCSIVVL